VNTMLAGMSGSFAAMLYMWDSLQQARRVDERATGLLAGPCGYHRALGIRKIPVASVIIGLIAGVLVCISVEFVDRRNEK